MNKTILDSIQSELKLAIAEKFNLNEQRINALSAKGQNTLLAALKQYVMSKGSGEIEEILLKKKSFSGSGLQTQVLPQLEASFKTESGIDVDQSKAIAGFSSEFIVQRIVDGFQNSGSSKDLEGICAFLNIDKNLLKMVNSPVGKILGKFF